MTWVTRVTGITEITRMTGMTRVTGITEITRMTGITITRITRMRG